MLRNLYICSRRLVLTPWSKLRLHTSVQKVLCSAFDKELPSPNMPTPVKKLFVHDTDILLEELQKAESINRILDLTSLHLDVMNTKHVVACCLRVHDLSKITDLKYLIADEKFQAFSSRLMKSVRYLDPQEVITVYKTFSALGAPNNSCIMNAILKMIGAHLNDMSLSQLTFVNFILSKQKHNSLVDGLRMAIPLVLQVQIDQQLDSKNVREITECLQMACKSRLKAATIEKIVNVLLQESYSIKPNEAITLIFALLNLEVPVDGYKELINVAFTVASNNIEVLDKREILIVAKMCHYQGFYHHKFFHVAIQRILSERWELASFAELVNHLYRLGVCHPTMMDYLSEVMCIESDEVRKKPFYSPLNFLEYFTATGHRPLRIEQALEVVCSCEDKIAKLCENAPHLLVKIASCLCMLGHFPEDIFSKALDETFLFEAWSSSKKCSRALEFERNVFNMVWCLKLYAEDKNFKVPPSVLKKAKLSLQQRYLNSEFPLAKFIENGLGGSQFLHSGIFTQDGLVIDHVMVMRSGNYPVALHQPNEDSKESKHFYLEDVAVPEDSKIVTLILAEENQYCKDPEVIKGWMDVKIKYLLKKGYAPVVINHKNWKALPDREKIPYLMREIKDAAEMERNVDTLKTSSSL